MLVIVRESDPQNGRKIQVKDLFHKLPRSMSAKALLNPYYISGGCTLRGGWLISHNSTGVELHQDYEISCHANCFNIAAKVDLENYSAN